ncbi:hypothetical protein [Natronorubrum texcoconense]|uniref:Uncharacterized protein n=1 Tax=Natronorubrum texcoconense TaxID=1095776 RepID=A0A1G9F2A4_9EURY|nr:hypothetical protein [Natronorubrum texcoconense]SDK82566.1 hypothetical protein SAMN04515672_4066 [Natronorubrum texcoconense]
MCTARAEPNDSEFLTGRVATTALAAGYLLVGIGFWVGLATGLIRLFVAVLAGTVVLVLVSLYIAVKREGLITAENKLIGVFVILGMGLLFGLDEFTALSEGIIYVLVLGVGALVPFLLLTYTEYGTST